MATFQVRKKEIQKYACTYLFVQNKNKNVKSETKETVQVLGIGMKEGENECELAEVRTNNIYLNISLSIYFCIGMSLKAIVIFHIPPK